MGVIEDKAILRKRIHQILAGISPESRTEKSRLICNAITGSEEYRHAAVVMLFLSMPREVDTTAIIKDAFQCGKTVAVPKQIEPRQMIPVGIRSLETGFRIDKMGLRNPVMGDLVSCEDIDLVIVPGLAFDRQGNRLGRGAAYYDRFLAEAGMRARTWAVAFSEQIVDAVPHQTRDVTMDALICEQGILKFRQ
jgi:5-formyltetrahydrofolate cyclo-ligase